MAAVVRNVSISPVNVWVATGRLQSPRVVAGGGREEGGGEEEGG